MTGITDLGALFGAGVNKVGSRDDNSAISTVSKGRSGTDGAASQVDQFSASTAGTALSDAFSGSDVRGDKVAKLQAAIANGSYSVPSGAIADKLIQTMLGKS